MTRAIGDRSSSGTHDIECGSISALDIPISIYYKLGAQSSDIITYAKGELLLIDIQYLGKFGIPEFMEMLQTPRVNSIYLSESSNISQVICEPQAKRSSPISKRNNGVIQYMLSHQPDTLNHYYTDYESILDNFVSSAMYAGAMTKMRRLPVISVYKNKEELKFRQVISKYDGADLSRDNTTNFIVYSDRIDKKAPHMFIIGTPSKLQYLHSYTINPSKMELKKVSGESALEAYKKMSDSDMMINGCELVKLISSVSSS